MRNFITVNSVLFFCLLSFTSIFTGNAHGDKIRIVGEEFPPFEFERDGKVVGIDVDTVRHIFNKMNIDSEIRLYPWARAWKMIKRGQADAVFSTSRKEKRMPYLYYPKADMWKSEYVFFVQKDKKKPLFKGYADAKGLTVGIIRGNSYHESFWKANLKTLKAADAEINFKRLGKGRIDLFPIDKTIGRYTLGLLGLKDKITYYDYMIFSKGYPMPFAKKSKYPDIKRIADQFEQELIEMKASGAYDKILNKWLK